MSCHLMSYASFDIIYNLKSNEEYDIKTEFVWWWSGGFRFLPIIESLPNHVVVELGCDNMILKTDVSAFYIKCKVVRVRGLIY